MLSNRAIGPRVRDNRIFEGVARLRQGVSLGQAQADLNAVAARLAAEYPQTNAAWGAATVVPLRTAIVGDVDQALMVVLMVVGFILLITIAFGLVFELPVVLYTLGRLGIISSGWLYKNRAYWLIGLGLLANFMTPGADPLTPLLVFVPLYVFWEATTLLLKLTGR